MLGWMVAIDGAFAASFECRKAQGRIEKMICLDSQLSELDEHLARYFEAAMVTLGRGDSCLRADQAQWLKSVRNVCKNNACLKTAYLNRLSELDALQPGATAIKHLELPRAATLVWVVPPALDTVAAPTNPQAKPLEVSGKLVNELLQNRNAEHAFVLRADDGTVYSLLQLMFVESKATESLAALARQKDAVYLVRGYAARDKDGKPYFEPSRCAFIYRQR
jgi:uncharacterized protein